MYTEIYTETEMILEIFCLTSESNSEMGGLVNEPIQITDCENSILPPGMECNGSFCDAETQGFEETLLFTLIRDVRRGQRSDTALPDFRTLSFFSLSMSGCRIAGIAYTQLVLAIF